MQDYLSAIDDISKEPYVDTKRLGCGSKAEQESTPAPAETQAEAGSQAEPSEPAESVAETPAASGEGKVYYLNFKPEYRLPVFI